MRDPDVAAGGDDEVGRVPDGHDLGRLERLRVDSNDAVRKHLWRRVPPLGQDDRCCGNCAGEQSERADHSRALAPMAAGRLGRCERRERRRQPLDVELKQPHRARDVLEPIRSELPERDARKIVFVVEEAGRCRRDEDLSPVTDRTHPRCTVNGKTDIAIDGKLRLSGMDAHSHTNGRPAAPAVVGKRPLTCRGSEHGVSRSRERDEEGLALVVDFPAAVRFELLAEDPVVVGQDRGVLGPVSLEQPRGALDVREQERCCGGCLTDHCADHPARLTPRPNDGKRSSPRLHYAPPRAVSSAGRAGDS